MKTDHEVTVGSHEPLGERRISEPELEAALERAVELAFAPLHKRVFGTAIGLVAAMMMALLTTIALIWQPRGSGLDLLQAYFYKYDVSFAGIFIGAAWAGLGGFVAGWFLAFVRNFALATWLLYVRVRANLSQTRDFLDHI